MTRTTLLPGDPHDRELREYTHPADWRNPVPQPRYDLVVVGGGTAGLVSAGAAGLLGAKVAIAHVGLYERDATDQGFAVQTLRVQLDEVDRAVTDGQTEGFLKLHVKNGTDRIVGATVVASHAGEMLSEITTAIVNRVGLKRLANVIHPYPTQAEAIRKAADEHQRHRFTSRLKRLLSLWLSLRR